MIILGLMGANALFAQCQNKGNKRFGQVPGQQMGGFNQRGGMGGFNQRGGMGGFNQRGGMGGFNQRGGMGGFSGSGQVPFGLQQRRMGGMNQQNRIRYGQPTRRGPTVNLR
jgi:hypothetical protein